MRNELCGAIVFCRLDSSRFPEKALAPFGKNTLIESVIDRVFSSRYQTVLATTAREVDNRLEEFSIKNNIDCFRGEALDVAKRAIDCAKHFGFTWFARVNGDSPFVFRSLLEQGFNTVVSENADMVTNLINRTYPYGVSVEIVKTSFYESIYEKFNQLEHFEHVTSYLYANSADYKILNFPALSEDFSKICLTVDTPEDLDRLAPIWRNVLDAQDSVEDFITKLSGREL